MGESKSDSFLDGCFFIEGKMCGQKEIADETDPVSEGIGDVVVDVAL